MTGARPTLENPELEIDFSDHQRRWTVLLRLILAIPHLVVLFFFSIALIVTVVIGWFAALVLGRLPRWAHQFVSDFMHWYTRVTGYLMLLTDRYPPFGFDSPQYPVRITLGEQRSLNRAAVLFRIILIIPVYIVSALLSNGGWLLGVVTWVVELVLGRIPVTLFEANAAVLRFALRCQAYGYMLTSAYPKKLFGDGSATGAPPTTRPLLLSSAAQAWIIVILILGLPNIRHDIYQALSHEFGQYIQLTQFLPFMHEQY
jgi:hypothetical protein